MMLDISVIRSPHSWAFLLIGATLYLIRRARQRKIASSPIRTPSKAHQSEDDPSVYTQIEPLSDLDLENEPPIKNRPFKPKYHLTMAIENITISELIAMDNTYLPRIAHRQHLLRTQYNSVLACNPISTPAVLELYTWLTTTYLPTRFPTLYTLHPTTLLNRLTNAHIPLHPASAPAALETLCANIDTDFLILLPSPDPEDEGRYRLQAFITCFPSGFHTRKKLGLLLAEIHGPVPGYKAKLERSMDRFFAALPVGRVVRRLNWSVTTGRDLYCPEGNHLYGEDGVEVGQEGEVVDLQDTVMRSERQTLHRLPETRALVFAFKTYQYELSEVKEEGNGEALAQAIEGLGEGNVPGMRIYKKSVVWGDKVTEYLRS